MYRDERLNPDLKAASDTLYAILGEWGSISAPIESATTEMTWVVFGPGGARRRGG
jgi:hypothetical protein